MTPTLRHYLEDGRSRIVAGAYDAFTATAIEDAGFEMVYVSGYGVAASLGLPDVGLATMTEMCESCARICEAVEVPVIMDADTGYGNALNVRRAVRALEGAGAAALQLEDQVFPKRCGHMSGKALVPTHEMVQKIRVAVESRRDERLVLIARTDAIAVEGIDNAIDRAIAYREAGADAVMVDAPTTLGEVKRITAEIPGPHVFDWSYGGVTPPISRSTLQTLGYALVVCPDLIGAVHHAVAAFLARLSNAELMSDLADHLTPFDSLNEFLDLDPWTALDKPARSNGN